MKYRLRIVDEAYSDIRRNADWWRDHYSFTEAEEWSFAILSKIRTMDQFPESHSLAYENPEVPYDLREALFGLRSRPGYRILFTVVDADVIVLGVRAAEQDWLQAEDLPPVPPNT
ncbi:MAG: hypothetical protein ABGZ35_09080 [Planctomycetaceae bacterium]|jgi:plasmid stabilization system protein ParE